MAEANEYASQHRGDAGAYERYLRGMDASMRQKVALTAAYLLSEGTVADMGMGSGSGSFALASLYPELEVIGVDVNPEMVRLAAERHRLPNLRFVTGDIAAPVFEPGALGGIFNSSVLHHVTTFNGYDHERAFEALAVQAVELVGRGVLIVRDFVAPGPGEVWLDLPTDDGDDDGAPGADDPMLCSTARLLERFAREFRALSDAPGFPCARVDPAACDPPLVSGWRRYLLTHRHAVEFCLRKDYRADWATEVQEEYTYWTQAEFEARFSALGLRVLASTPIRNPWIVENRFRGALALWSPDGVALELPPTNYLISGEKVPATEGVAFSEGAPRAPLGYCELTHWRRRDTGRVMDLVRRPNATVDVLPWFRRGERVYVLARMSYPRPILVTDAAGPALGGARAAGYITEPLNVLQTDHPLGTTVEEALQTWAGIGPTQILRFEDAGTYYPSPGGVQEEVRSVHVQVEPVFEERAIGGVSGFSTSGRVRAIEARQLLRATQVEGLPDARLELNAYALLARRGVSPGPWIGGTIELERGEAPPQRGTIATLRDRPQRRRFERAPREESAGFLELRCADFEERNAAGEVLATRPLEHVVPGPLSLLTVVTAPLVHVDGEVWIGVDDDDLPAAQCFRGQSQLLVAPAWRLPHDRTALYLAHAWIRERLERECGLDLGRMWTLGGRYHPSPGVTAEVVHPLAFEVFGELGGERRGERQLTWLPLRDTARHAGELRDGHLRVVSCRAAHALGLLD
jgi:hypothetical protein